MKETTVKTNKLIFIIGIIITLLPAIPYFLLGGDFITPYHDQLDGEIFTYIFHAKYLFTGVNVYPELMNGLPSTGLTPPCVLPILLYVIFSPIIAFKINLLFCSLVGYIGMYLCAHRISRNAYISVICGLLFAFLPLYSVYGLAQWGIPLLIIAILNLYEKKYRVLSFLYILLYGLMSSFVLIGFAVLGFGLVGILYLLFTRKLKKHLDMLFAFLLLLCTYLISNMSLIMQIFGIGNQIPSHKEELVRYGENFFTSFWEVFYNGTMHTPSHQWFIVIFSFTVIILMVFFRRKFSAKLVNKLKVTAFLFAFQILCCAFYGFVHTPFIAEIRNSIGGVVKEFQPDRIFWLTVPVWYLILAFCLSMINDIIRENCKKLFSKIIFYTSLFVSVLICSLIVLRASDFKNNIQRLRLGEQYKAMTWNAYYSPDVFDEIAEYIGRDKTSYKVLSLKLQPASALYNGFYTIDGYSNNYPLPYKYEFRKIIAGEIDKSDYLKFYYDEWGCRCYLFTADVDVSNCLFPKGSGVTLSNLSFDFDSARNLGAEYLFSAVPIDNPETLGLLPVRETPFSSFDSYYEIYVYKI